ncbi:MAG: YceD family protein [Bordetella sp.]|uniref:YceD family protein n=1 Tax=Bordetella sp. TaxID=28081 RepID=UPI003F7CC941
MVARNSADPRNVDVFALAKNGGLVEGEIALVRLLRLCEGLPEQSGLAAWQVQGSIGQGTGKTGVISGQSLLHLHVRADLLLDCQRCGQPFAFPVDAQAMLQLVESEADLDDELSVLQDDDEDSFSDDEDEDDENAAAAPSTGHPEKVVGSRHFDLLAQVEDELILNVPYVPRHDVCPGAQASAAAKQEPTERRPSPFAVLEQLKRR